MHNKIVQKKTGWNLDYSYLQLPDIFYAKIMLENTCDSELVVVNASLAETLGLDVNLLQEKGNVELFSGCKALVDSPTIAQAYAGHQFGHFTMLGDGRTVLIGEQLTPSNERLDIQLKGSGKTPYSRGGDGKATLGPMLREYIISEAMHVLGIPTTRSLAVVKTGETVFRERDLPGAILTRVAASHIRVGTFQYAANWGRAAELKDLVNSLLIIMQQYHADYTNTFRALTVGKYDELELFESTDFKEWHHFWVDRKNQESDQTDSQAVMRVHNPAVIPRNHRVEEALKAAVELDDYTVMNKLLAILADPYGYTRDQEAYTTPPILPNAPYVTYCGT